MNVIEDEVHFLFYCPFYSNEREHFFEKVCERYDNFHNLLVKDKFVFLMKSDIVKQTAAFLQSMYMKRRNVLYK